MRRSLRRRLVMAVTALCLVSVPSAGDAQDSNILLPIAEIERRLSRGEFEIIDPQPSRGLEGERTFRAVLQFADSLLMQVKWAAAPRGGSAFNNEPRLEIAAYELQKLFLDEAEYVVPPTIARCVPGHSYPELETMPRARSTFHEWDAVLVVLQYWLWNVDGGSDARDLIDPERFARDSVYARHAANFNLLTYLIRHRDSNRGNFLRSRDPANPRLFSVDNGIAFESAGESDRGQYWERLRVDRVTRSAVEKLRSLTRDDLRRALGVIAQFEEDGEGNLRPVEPTFNLEPEVGIRRRGSVLQLGLTELEIRRLYERIEQLLRDVDDEKLEVF